MSHDLVITRPGWIADRLAGLADFIHACGHEHAHHLPGCTVRVSTLFKAGEGPTVRIEAYRPDGETYRVDVPEGSHVEKGLDS